MSPASFRLPWKDVAKHSFQSLVLVTAGFAIGLIVNRLRDKPLSLVYESKELQLEKAVAHLTAARRQPRAANDILPPQRVTLEQLQQFIKEKRGLVFDARPETFYRFGHIPSALSLPREDFENAYKRFQTGLERNRAQPLIIYCSNEFCENAAMVQRSLQGLGYSNVAIFAGGWREWQEKGLPEESKQ
jgi:rhodanese-related sulfurtransferase